MADEVPAGPAADRWKDVGRLLDIVLADDPDAGIDGLEDFGGRPRLCGDDELDAALDEVRDRFGFAAVTRAAPFSGRREEVVVTTPIVFRME